MGKKYPFISDIADAYLERHNIKIDTSSVEYTKLCNEILKTNIRLDSIITEHLAGNYETEYDKEIRSRRKSKTFRELIELYEKDKKEKWTDKYRLPSIHRQLLHIIGDIALDEIDRATSINLREALKEYPLKLTAAEMKIPWQELSRTRPGRLADKTQKMILTQYNSLVEYAKENDLGVKGSPAKRIADNIKTMIKKKDRKPYTPEELQRLINILALVDRDNDPEFFWIPLLLLFSGSRSNEICMLRCDDVELRGDIWMLCFRNRKEHKQRTKNGKDRQAPIHNALIKLGFLDFVKKQREVGHDRIFSNLVLIRDKWNIYFGKDYNRTFKNRFLVNYSKAQLREKDLHSFRPTMISWFVRRKEYMNITDISILQSIVGHFEKFDISTILQFLKDSKLTLIDYGGGFGAEFEQSALLQKLDYEIDFSPLFSK
jgi:integrase